MEAIEFKGFGGTRIVGSAFGSLDSPPVVLLPSLGQVRNFWYGSANALAEAGRYAICVDLRGHGDSDHSAGGHYDLDAHVADLRAVLASLPSRATVVTAGLGALIALAAVGEGEAHLVASLALIDANIWVDRSAVDRVGGADGADAITFDGPDKILDTIMAAYPSEPRPAMTERLMAAYRLRDDGRYEWRGDPHAVAPASLLDVAERMTTAAGTVGVPVMLVRGSLNDALTAEKIGSLQAMIRGAEVAEIDGAGRYASSDREDDFNAILLDFLERQTPREPLSFIGGSEPRILRDALGCFATGVTVVTTNDADGNPIGLTANSFTSVSLDPPLILFSLAKSSANLDVFKTAGKFAVNVLHIGQQPVGWKFATRGESRFDGVNWSAHSDGGSPILSGALASFDCHTHAIHDGGDHFIFVGHVDHAWYEPRRDPLLYFRGKFRRLHFA